MAKAYSQDLRERIRRAWEDGGSTRAGLAARFGVSVSCVRDLIRRVRRTGSVAPSARVAVLRAKRTSTKSNSWPGWWPRAATTRSRSTAWPWPPRRVGRG